MFVDPPSAPSSPYQGLLESHIRGSTFILTEVGGAARSEEARTRRPPPKPAVGGSDLGFCAALNEVYHDTRQQRAGCTKLQGLLRRQGDTGSQSRRWRTY